MVLSLDINPSLLVFRFSATFMFLKMKLASSFGKLGRLRKTPSLTILQHPHLHYLS